MPLSFRNNPDTDATQQGYSLAPISGGTWKGPLSMVRERAPAPSMSLPNVDSRSNFLKSLAVQRLQDEQNRIDRVARSQAFDALPPDQKAAYSPGAGESTGSLVGVDSQNHTSTNFSDNSLGIAREKFINSQAGAAIHGEETVLSRALRGDLDQYYPSAPPPSKAQLQLQGQQERAGATVEAAQIGADARVTAAQTAAAARPGVGTEIVKGLSKVGAAVANNVGKAATAFVNNASRERIAQTRAGSQDWRQDLAKVKMDDKLRQDIANELGRFSMSKTRDAMGAETHPTNEDVAAHMKEYVAQRTGGQAPVGQPGGPATSTQPFRAAPPIASTDGGVMVPNPDGTFTHPAHPGEKYVKVPGGYQKVK